jgi:hypothetical protein
LQVEAELDTIHHQEDQEEQVVVVLVVDPQVDQV